MSESDASSEEEPENVVAVPQTGVSSALADIQELKAVYEAAGLSVGGPEFKKDCALIMKRMRKTLGGKARAPKRAKEERPAPAEPARKYPYTPSFTPHTVIATHTLQKASMHEAVQAVDFVFKLNEGVWSRYEGQPSCHHRPADGEPALPGRIRVAWIDRPEHPSEPVCRIVRVLQAQAPSEGANGKYILQELEVKNSFVASDDEEEEEKEEAPAPAADASPSKETKSGRQVKPPNRLSSGALQ
jgi:hypothetical protein